MKQSLFGFVALLVMVLMTIVALQSAVLGMASRPPVVGSPAPEFQLSDLDGETRSLLDYRGKIVLLNFWATWCKPCITEMPAMQEAYDELKDQGFVVIAVNELEDQERVREHITSHGHTFTVLMDHDNTVANMYGVVGLPVSIFIDETGRVQEYVKGSLLTKERILQTVDRLVADTQVRPTGRNNS